MADDSALQSTEKALHEPLQLHFNQNVLVSGQNISHWCFFPVK